MRFFGLWLSIVASFTVLASALSDEPRRIVAIGDLHGDYINAVKSLNFANITDLDGHWIGGDAILVQTGDIVDRGMDTIELYRMMQELEIEAKAQGGQVIVLLGNHEIMNLIGDWRYVLRPEIRKFGSKQDRINAFKPDGSIGSYLVGLNTTAKVGSTVFVHGGLHPKYAKHGIDWINAETHAAMPEFIETNGQSGDPHDIFGGDGPTWYRAYAVEDEAKVCPLLEEALKMLEADRMVVGHSVQRDGRIRTRCNGKIVLIDIGIGFIYGGNLGSLEIVGDKLSAIYRKGPELLFAPQTPDLEAELAHEEL
ncbi:Metallo-dependent phosphatase-like protein [Radiomyces spectabilis]|uniref:Metallo-dependent phosphatase-like protein n=1 Tax=Radiomyces spectabilis TaxID=64574 RepID=UPI00221F5192|nr:Metallo-dependent phosphatase-like protein [Radiomyces spectabilis]KAI8384640.1 Metallo-dependent phosphatase-like protein [Radiomyces spectabilis]